MELSSSIQRRGDLGIRNLKRPQIRGMGFRKISKFWQSVAINALLEFEDGPLGEGFLCDAVGPGKTWNIIALLLVVSTNSFHPSHRLPHFFLLPSSLFSLPPSQALPPAIPVPFSWAPSRRP